ncbi:MAG TPA: lysophospholipid acyltransferase family protein [Polyangiaceae bacterium]
MIDGLGALALRPLGRAAGLLFTTACLGLEPQVGVDAASFARRAQRTARTLLAVQGVEVTCEGPSPEGPAVLVTNHVSYLDPLVVSLVAPCISIAKGETGDWPLFGRGLRALGVVFVRRGDPHSGALALFRAYRALREGTTVLNFPEGTTSDGRGVGPFHRGIFGLARLAGVPVVPAHLSYDDDRVPWFGGQTLAPHYLRLSRAAKVRARVRFAGAIRPAPSDEPHAIAARARDIVSALADA